MFVFENVEVTNNQRLFFRQSLKEKSKPKKAKIEDKYGQMQKQPHVLKSVVRIQEWICKNTALVLSEEKIFLKSQQ